MVDAGDDVPPRFPGIPVTVWMPTLQLLLTLQPSLEDWPWPGTALPGHAGSFLSQLTALGIL